MVRSPEPRLREPMPIHPIEITLGEINGACVVALAGELDIATSPRVGVALHEQLRRKPACLIIDLAAVDFVDATGFSILLNARRRAVRERVGLRLVCDVPSTLRLIRLLRLEDDLEVLPTLSDAAHACAAEREASRASLAAA